MQPEQNSAAPTPQAPQRLALVIGNSRYERAGQLSTVADDADAIADRLIDLGFTVRLELDLGAEQLAAAVQAFIAELAHASNRLAAAQQPTTAVVYYAGNAVQVLGENYLLPVDGTFDTETDVKRYAVSLDEMMSHLRINAAASIVLLDCCRANPMPRLLGPDGQSRTLTVHHGLAEARVPRGVLLAYATQPDTIAEPDKGGLSPFTAALVKYLDLPDATVGEMLSQVRRHVSETTGGRQLPWDRSALVQPVMLRPVRQVRQVPLQQMLADEQAEAGRASEYWSQIATTRNPELIRSFLHQFPHSPHRPEAVARLDLLRWEGLRKRIATRTAAVLAGLVLIAASWIGIEYSRFSDGDGVLANAAIVGNDIDVPGSQTTPGSMAACRLRCILSTRCTAITWTPLPEGAGAAPRSAGTCAMKLAASHVVRPGIVRHAAGPRSEIMRRRGAELPADLPAGSSLLVDLTLVGEAVPRDRVLARAGFLAPDGRPALREDPQTGKFHWRATDAACHQRCEELGGDCKGYSYTPLGQRCLLLRTVKGVARDSDGSAVHTPSVHSVCFDKTVADCRGTR